MFDGWCIEHSIDHWDLPADRWLNLIYYFATRNTDKEGRDKFNEQMHQAETEWLTMKVQRTRRTGDAESTEKQRRAQSPEAIEQRLQRERRLPPKPDWYGSRESATASTILAKKALTSRGGMKTPKR
jgi:hypothetical protein